MTNKTIPLIAGVLLFVVAALVLLASLLPGVGLPAATYVLVGIGLFGGVYLIGVSYPDRAI